MWFAVVCLQVKLLAKDIYSQHFRAAQAVPRGVVAKLCSVVRQLEAACDKHTCQVSATSTVTSKFPFEMCLAAKNF